MDERLKELQQELIKAMIQSGQGSYQRRMPSQDSVAALESIQSELQNYLEDHPNNPNALRRMSQAMESLMCFSEAVRCLERAIQIEGRSSRKDQKKMQQLRILVSDWTDLRLAPIQLRELGAFLKACGADNPQIGSTLRFTRSWLAANCEQNQAEVLEALRYRGGTTDFLVILNVVHG